MKKLLMIMMLLSTVALADIVALKNGSVYQNVRIVTDSDIVTIEHYLEGEIKTISYSAKAVRFTEKQDYDLTQPAITLFDPNYAQTAPEPVAKQQSGLHYKQQPNAGNCLQKAGNFMLFSQVCGIGGVIAAVYASPYVVVGFVVVGVVSQVMAAQSLKNAGKMLEN